MTLSTLYAFFVHEVFGHVLAAALTDLSSLG